MKILVGLGNPGKKYQNNRHNIGFMFVDYMIDQIKSQKLKIKSDKYLKSEVFRIHNNSRSLILIKPQTFMNNSGQVVKQVIRNLKLEIRNLFIAHDDLDIPLGKFKIQKGTGPKLHNGLASIEQHLKTKDFWRIRIGIDNRPPDSKIPGEKYVLEDFTPEEKQILFKNTFFKIFTHLKSVYILKKGTVSIYKHNPKKKT